MSSPSQNHDDILFDQKDHDQFERMRVLLKAASVAAAVAKDGKKRPAVISSPSPPFIAPVGFTPPSTPSVGVAAAASTTYLSPAWHQCNLETLKQQELDTATTKKAIGNIEKWWKQFHCLCAYQDQHGHCNPPQQVKGVGVWVNKQRENYKFWQEENKEKQNHHPTKPIAKKRPKSTMTKYRIEALESIHFQWGQQKGETSWASSYKQLQQFYGKHGHSNYHTYV